MDLHPVWAPFPDIQARLTEVTDVLKSVLEDSPELIRSELELILNPGKMLRPAFLLMASTAGAERSVHIPRVAAAIELLHTATLIHDDVIDQASSRRNKPTLHTKVGIKRAVLAGDYLLARSMELASAANNELLIAAMNKAVSSLCRAEIDQDSNPGNYFISQRTYFERIRGKTAELFALSCHVGALLGGATEELSDQFHDIGLNFGLAFQIADDVLDYRGSPNRMGKPIGNDLKDGIPTLPLILALEDKNRRIEKMCRSRFKYLYRHTIRKNVLQGGFDAKAASIGDEYLGICLESLQSIKFADRELFSSIINGLKIREV